MVIRTTLLALLFVIIPLTGFGSDKATYGLIKTYFKTNLEQDDLDTIFEHNPKVLGKIIKQISRSKEIVENPKYVGRFIELLSLLDENVDDDDLLDIVDELSSQMNDRMEYLAKRKKSYHSFVTAQYNSWQDSFTVKSLNSSEEKSYKSMNRGPCVGGGVEYGNLIYRIGFDLCVGAIITFSNTEEYRPVDGDGNLAGYSGVDMIYLKSQLGYRYFLSDKSSLSIGLPIIFRMTDYVVPEQSELSGTTYFNFGVNLGYHFKLMDSLNFYTAFGGFIGSGALSWNNGLNWLF